MRRLDALAGRGMLVEGRLSPDSDFVGETVAEITLPSEAFVLSVRRGEETVSATGKTRIMSGDELVVVTRPENVEALARLLPPLDGVTTQLGEPML